MRGFKPALLGVVLGIAFGGTAGAQSGDEGFDPQKIKELFNTFGDVIVEQGGKFQQKLQQHTPTRQVRVKAFEIKRGLESELNNFLRTISALDFIDLKTQEDWVFVLYYVDAEQ